MRIALFITCYNDVLYPDVGQAVVRLFDRLGMAMDFPREQACCGQLHFNTGYQEQSLPMATRFARTFAGFDAVVTPSPSCASMVRHHYATLAQRDASGELSQQLGQLVPRVYELSEFLLDVLGITDVGATFARRVVYHPTCHGRRLLGLGHRPVRLLQAVRGLTLVDLPNDDACCGFGGTFSVKNEATSIAMGLDKVRDLLSTGAEVLTAADTSCLLHISGLASRANQKLEAVHLAQILAADE